MVFPLYNSTLARFLTPRTTMVAGLDKFTYTGPLSSVPAAAPPNILQKDYTISAEIEVPEGGGEGMIVTHGGRFGGYGLFLTYGLMDLEAARCSSTTFSTSSAPLGWARS